jgi:tRNA/rRNA methyltransferase
MANMGLDRLILVAPQCELTEEAKQGAAHAQQVLRDSVRYNSHDEFMAAEGEGIRIALSGKDGRLKAPDWLDNILTKMREESPEEHPFFDSTTPIYLFFGPEDDGLSFEEMALCHHVCRLPTFGEITSLNLSHAVLLTCFMVQTALGRRGGDTETREERPLAAAYYPSETIKAWLEALGMNLSARRVSIDKTLNRIFLSRCPTPNELRVVDNILQQTVRKLRDPQAK